LRTCSGPHGSLNYLRNSGDVEIHMTVEDSVGEKTQEASRFLGSPPVAADPNELDAIRLERDSLQDEIVRLRAQNKQQADRSASAEKAAAEPAQKANSEPPKTERAKVEPPKSEAPKAERAAPVSSSGGPSGTYLQLAATSKSEAEIMVDALRRKRFESIAAEIPENAGTYRVLVGPVHDGNVNKLRADLQDAGFPGKGAIKRMF
jgi:sporulation related protein